MIHLQVRKLDEIMLKGFYEELEKRSADLASGAEGLAIGALIGAALGGIGPLLLEKLISRNRDIAIATGALFGAGMLGAAGFVLGKKSPPAVTAQIVSEEPPAVPPRHQYTLR